MINNKPRKNPLLLKSFAQKYLQMHLSIKRFSLLVITVILSINCSTKEDSTDIPVEENQHLINLMSEWYLWSDTFPARINASSYENPDAIIEALTFKDFDRWTYSTDASRYISYFDEGTYVGYGFSYVWDNDGNIRFRYVYNDSPFGRENIKRGWKLLEIDGQDIQLITDWSTVFGESEIGVTQTFVVEDESGVTKEFTASKDLVSMNTVLYADTMSIGVDRVGYMVFNSFLEVSRDEIEAAFSLFESQNINKLILDLRYNGGGRLSVANYLAGHIIQSEDQGKSLYSLIFNSSKSENNSDSWLNKQNLLELEELIVLGTGGTASASELIINGLSPLMDVTLIGTENTYGKPVGSNGWYNLDRTRIYSIISFKIQNSEQVGEYFDGISPDFTACDDYGNDFGDPNESFLAAAVEYIETGSTSGCDIQTKIFSTKPELPQEQPEPILLIDSEFN